MDPVEYHLKLAIYHWCGAAPGQYVVDSQLRDIWAAHIPALPYEPEGIRRFHQALYSDGFFSGCPAAQGMIPGEFMTGGDLQTVRQIYNRLLPCATGPVDAGAPPTFQ
ncbi:MAG: hypothetical protein ACLQOO_08630 [Terriglobia bacterium]